MQARGALISVASVAALAVLAATACLASEFTTPLELTSRINPGPSCTRMVILGLCWCGYTPCGYRVAMYVPVAFVETVRAPGDSLLGALPALPAPPASALSGTVSSRSSGLDNTAEVHAWAIGDTAWELAARPPCATCRPSDAQVPPPAPMALPMCGQSLQLGADSSGASQSSWNTMLPSLVYASELDAFNWHTGCRDQQAALLPDLPLAGALGQWGPLHPRQMRDLGTTPIVFSAKTAYRALSIARDQLASFYAPVDLAARMQQAYPAVSACFAVGEQPLPEPVSSPQPVRASADGRYGWFYWRPVTCCIGYESMQRCARP